MEQKEKQKLIDYCTQILNEKCAYDFYYDNPSAAIEDVEYLANAILILLK